MRDLGQDFVPDLSAQGHDKGQHEQCSGIARTLGNLFRRGVGAVFRIGSEQLGPA